MNVMLTIDEIRYRNARLLVRGIEESTGKSGDRSGAMTAFAAKMGKSPAQASHFAGEKPSKAIGDQIAREIEVAFNKERGWMDWPQWEMAAAESCKMRPDASKLQEAHNVLRRLFLGNGGEYEYMRDSDLLAEAYDLDAVDPVGRTIALMARVAQRVKIQEKAHGGKDQASKRGR